MCIIVALLFPQNSIPTKENPMFKELYRLFTTRRSVAQKWIHRKTALQVVEYPRGVFKVFRHREDDLLFWKGRSPDFKDIYLCDCCGARGFEFRDVLYTDDGRFQAPSLKDVLEALDFVEIWE